MDLLVECDVSNGTRLVKWTGFPECSDSFCVVVEDTKLHERHTFLRPSTCTSSSFTLPAEIAKQGQLLMVHIQALRHVDFDIPGDSRIKLVGHEHLAQGVCTFTIPGRYLVNIDRMPCPRAATYGYSDVIGCFSRDVTIS